MQRQFLLQFHEAAFDVGDTLLDGAGVYRVLSFGVLQALLAAAALCILRKLPHRHSFGHVSEVPLRLLQAARLLPQTLLLLHIQYLTISSRMEQIKGTTNPERRMEAGRTEPVQAVDRRR